MTIPTNTPNLLDNPPHPTATKEQEMRSPQNTATTPARSWFVRGRLVGATAIALGSVGGDPERDVGLGRPPAYGDPIEEVLAWHAQTTGSRSRSRSAWRR